MTKQQLHSYVIGGVVVFTAIAATFPMAMSRVSETKKLAGQPVRSLDCHGKPTKAAVDWLQTCVNR
jgi:hypothetical protein